MSVLWREEVELVSVDLEVVKARRERIQREAPCEDCGTTLETCEANRGEDPDAPPWFGCCARDLGPCRHEPDQRALLVLLREIESGTVRHLDELLLDQIREYPIHRLLGWLTPDDIREQYEEATWD